MGTEKREMLNMRPMFLLYQPVGPVNPGPGHNSGPGPWLSIDTIEVYNEYIVYSGSIE